MAEIVETAEAKVGRCKACGCVGPNPGYDSLPLDQCLADFATLNPLSLWKLSEDGKLLSRQFVCRNWQAAIQAIELISTVAESKEVQHHPDLHLTNYRQLDIVIQTHATGGLTNFDFVLARGIDALTFDYSPKWKKENLPIEGSNVTST